MRELAARREIERLGHRYTEFFHQKGRPRFKNFFGAILVQQSMPAYTKVVDAYWRIEDARIALLARVSG